MQNLVLFNENVKKINLNSSIEQNNFTLVRDYLNGDIVEKKDGISHYALSDEFIIESINEIKTKIKAKHYCGEFKLKLQEKINKICELYSEFKTFEKMAEKFELTDIEIEMRSENTSKLFYFILELKISLGLSLEDIFSNEIMCYCSAIENDVNNEKYKRLDFQSHVSDNGNIKLFK